MTSVTDLKVNTEFFTDRIADLDLSSREAAKRLNMHFASLHRTINGKRKVQLDELVAIADLLRLPLEDVIENFGVRIRHAPATAEIINRLERGVLLPYEGATKRIPSPVEDSVAIVDAATGWVYFAPPVAKTIQPEAVGRMALVAMRGGDVELGTLNLDRLSGRYSVTRLDGTEVRSANVVGATPVVFIKP